MIKHLVIRYHHSHHCYCLDYILNVNAIYVFSPVAYGRLMVDVAEDLTLDSTLRLAILLGLPPAESDMLRRISLVETPGITLINFLKTRNIINMYDVTNLQKGLLYLHLKSTNETHLVPYHEKIDTFQFEENRSPDILDWPGKNCLFPPESLIQFQQNY